MSTLDVLLNHFPPYFLRQDLSLNMELAALASLGNQGAPGKGLFLSSQHALPHLALYVVARNPQPRSLADAANALLTELSPQPPLLVLKSRCPTH